MLKLLISLTCLFIFLSTQAQLNEADRDLLKHTSPLKEKPALHQRKARFVLPQSDSWLIKYNPFSLTYASAVWGYQKIISNQFSASCYYIPTCSEFSQELIHEFGVVKGLLLTADRLMRCNRIAATGFHPISIDKNSGKIYEFPAMFKIKTDENP